MRWECRKHFPRRQLERKPLVSDPGMHHGTCVMHGPWCMSGSLTRCGGENVPGIPDACASRNFTYLARCPWDIPMAEWLRCWLSEPHETHWGCWCRDTTASCKGTVRRWFMYFIHEYSLILHHSYVLIYIIEVCFINWHCGNRMFVRSQ